MAFLIETIICAVLAYLVTLLLSVIRKKDTPNYTKFPWGRWCFALMLGGGGGGLINGALQGAIFGGIGNWAAFGAAIGIMQWLVLSRYIPVGMFWALASTIGWSSLALFQALVLPTPLDWFLSGIIVGLLQWLLIRKTVANCRIWVLVNGVAWLAGGFTGVFGGLAFLQVVQNPVITWLVGWTFIGLIAALILGLALADMKPITQEPAEENSV
jgi:hypothetical protein